MAWTSQNLYVAADEREAVLAALEALLVDPAHGAASELLADAPPPLIVGPVCDGGFVPVIGLRGWVERQPDFVRALSAAPGIRRVVGSEVIGACYRLRHCEAREGEQVALDVLPEGGWDEVDEVSGGAGEGATERPMPLYRDVEQLGLALLLDLGLTPTVALIGTTPPLGGEQVELGEATALERRGEGIARRSLPLKATRYDDGSAEAPVLLRQVGRDFGLHFFDDRFVEGVPTAAAVDRLVKLEDKILDRGRRLYGKELTLTMSYYSGGYQDELDDLLAARDRQVPARTLRRSTIPWWQFWRFFGKFR